MPQLLKTTFLYYMLLVGWSLSSLAKEFELEPAPKGVAPDSTITEKGTAEKVSNLLGVPLKTKTDETKEEIEKIKSPRLKEARAFSATQSRQSLHVQDHTPLLGKADAQVLILYYLDLSCQECHKQQKEIYDLVKSRQEKGENIALAHKFNPKDPFSSNNIATFYSRIAQEYDLYWPYFEKVMALPNVDESDLRNILLSLGVPADIFKYNLRHLSRKLYKQLDNEQYESKQLNLHIRPAIFVNGVLIGGGISFDDINAFIDFEYTLANKKITTVKGL